MKHQLYGPDDYKRMLWKNGQGVTREIRREPAEGDFNWRLSIAQIKENGPFSKFPGYTRIINTLRGQGMILTVDGQKSRPLRQYDPFIFDGSSEVESELLDGPIEDFNLIYNPDTHQASLKWLQAAGETRINSEAGLVFIYADGPVRVEAGSEEIILPEGSTLEIANSGGDLALSLSGLSPAAAPHFCLIEISSN